MTFQGALNNNPLKGTLLQNPVVSPKAGWGQDPTPYRSSSVLVSSAPLSPKP